MNSVLLVDDHKIILDGIKAMLEKESNINIIGEAHNGAEAIKMVHELNPDIVLMDISMPELSGIEATKKIVQNFPHVKILILTQHESKEYILEVLKSGAHGYLLKNSKKEELLLAVNKVMSGEKYLGDKTSTILLDEMINPQKDKEQDKDPKILLTKREIEIIKLIANDKNNNEIADQLSISLRTVETHRRNIMQKLEVNSVVALVRYALRNNITSL